MDVPMPPTQVDDMHLIPWVLGVLFLCVIGLAKLFIDGNRKCEERSQELTKKYEESLHTTQTLLVNCIQENTAAFRSLRRDMRERDFIPQDEDSDPNLQSLHPPLKLKR